MTKVKPEKNSSDLFVILFFSGKEGYESDRILLLCKNRKKN